jgi:hypothetical protein
VENVPSPFRLVELQIASPLRPEKLTVFVSINLKLFKRS